MKKNDDPIERVQVTLTTSVRKAINKYAEERHWTVSYCIREAIKLYLHEKTRKRKGDK